MSNENEKEIIDKLKKLPKIVDESNKDKLFLQIASRLENETASKHKKNKIRYLPLLATAAVLIFAISIPLLLMNINNQIADSGTEINTAYDSSMTESQENAEIAEFSTEESYRSEDSIVHDAEEENSVIDRSRVVHSLDNNSQLIHFSTYEDQLQYTIPISLVVSDEVDRSNYYNVKEDILASYDLLPEQYLLQNVKYEIDSSEKLVTAFIPDDFSIRQGSARTSMFQHLHEEMFGPYGIEKVKFEFADANTADAGVYSIPTELDLEANQQASYLLYKDNYFIRIPQNSSNIDEAINSLQRDISDFDIHKTIPEAINFQIEAIDGTLIFEYISGASDINRTMIESILLTAKSYNYKHVLFENFPISELGEYQFSKPISVPLGANPIKSPVAP